MLAAERQRGEQSITDFAKHEARLLRWQPRTRSWPRSARVAGRTHPDLLRQAMEEGLTDLSRVHQEGARG